MSGTDQRLPPPGRTAARVPEQTGPCPELRVGDRVVYAGHGIGRISAMQAVGRDHESVVVLELAGTLTVTLPAALASETLRSVSSEAELVLVQRALQEVSPPQESSWSRRLRDAKGLVARGEAVGLAEIVREGIRREHRSAATGRPITSSSERELYVKARQLLANEISVSRGVDLAAADLWIADQVPAEEDVPA